MPCTIVNAILVDFYEVLHNLEFLNSSCNGNKTEICGDSWRIISYIGFLSEMPLLLLTHWGRVTHICVGKLTIIGSDNGLSPGRPQAIIRTNAGILLIRPLGTNFSEILSEINTFSFKKMYLKMSYGRWRQFCLSLNVLIKAIIHQYSPYSQLLKAVVVVKRNTNVRSINGIQYDYMVWDQFLKRFYGLMTDIVWFVALILIPITPQITFYNFLCKSNTWSFNICIMAYKFYKIYEIPGVRNHGPLKLFLKCNNGDELIFSSRLIIYVGP